MMPHDTALAVLMNRTRRYSTCLPPLKKCWMLTDLTAINVSCASFPWIHVICMCRDKGSKSQAYLKPIQTLIALNVSTLLALVIFIYIYISKVLPFRCVTSSWPSHCASAVVFVDKKSLRQNTQGWSCVEGPLVFCHVSETYTNKMQLVKPTVCKRTTLGVHPSASPKRPTSQLAISLFLTNDKIHE